MTTAFKKHILNWLIELEEEKSIKLFNDCEIRHFYIDTGFQVDSDFTIDMYKIIIDIPLKIYKNIQKYSHEVNVIESAIKDSGESNGIFVMNIDWSPYLPNKYNIKSGEVIKELFNRKYINRQINLMNSSINDNPHLSLGISKELIETCCKYILQKAKIEINENRSILKLVKVTNKNINFLPLEVKNIDLAKSAITKILSGLSIIVHGITELRNLYGI